MSTDARGFDYMARCYNEWTWKAAEGVSLQMAMNEKLDPELAMKLRDFLKKNHIDRKRIVIDVESETIELEPVEDLEEILSAPPDFTEEEAAQARSRRYDWLCARCG